MSEAKQHGNDRCSSQSPFATSTESRGFDPNGLSHDEQFKLLLGSVCPRPIALVTTLGPAGPNAAPFSFFNAFSVDPPMLAFSASANGGVLKDTIRNIRDMGEFVVHLIDDTLKDKMNVTSIEFAREINEIEEAGFTAVPSMKVRPPRLAECPVAMECILTQILPLGRIPHHMVIGEVVYFHFREGLVNERMHVNTARLNPLGRLAGTENYTRITDRFAMPRLEVPKGKERTAADVLKSPNTSS